MTHPRDIPTRLVDLPYSIPGIASVDENGEPMVYLNARLTEAQHRRTFEHELRHIQRDDFFNGLSIYQAEGQKAPDPLPETAKPVEAPGPRKRTRKAPQTPQQYLRKVYDTLWIQLSDIGREALQDMFSHMIADMEEMQLRGWILYGLTKDSPHWKQILLTYALYGTNLPRRADPAAAELLKGAIPHETMKRVLYALVEPVPGISEQ